MRAHRVVKIKARGRVRTGIVSGENRNDDARALEDESEIIAQQFRKRAHFAVHAHLLQLGAPEKLERMLEDARHFPRCRRHPRDRHDGVPVDLEHFISAIVNDGVAGGGAAIARHQHAALEFEGEDGGRLGEGNISGQRCCRSHRTDRTYVTYSPQ